MKSKVGTSRPPAGRSAARVPAWTATLVRLMDDAIPIPGTTRRVGLDAILGFLAPGLGDALSAVSGLVLIVVAFGVRVPGIVLARMTLNVGIDALVGVVPLVGDLFDVGWKSNRRNLDLIERFQRPGAVPTPADYVVVAASLAALLAILLLPLLALGWFVGHAFPPRR